MLPLGLAAHCHMKELYHLIINIEMSRSVHHCLRLRIAMDSNLCYLADFTLYHDKHCSYIAFS